MVQTKPNTETIVTVITGAEQGRVFDKANEQLTELVEECDKLQSKGKLTITIEVGAIKGKDAMEVGVLSEVKLPKSPAMTKPYFMTADSKLTKKHGSQPDLPNTGEADDEEAHDPATGEILSGDAPVADNVTSLNPNK